MAKKTYCDGCGKEMPPQVSVLAAVALLDGSNVQIASRDPGGMIDLCETCVCKAFAQKLFRDDLLSLLPSRGAEPWPSQSEGTVLRAGELPKKLVGRELTNDMLEAADRCNEQHVFANLRDHVRFLWRAMFDAA